MKTLMLIVSLACQDCGRPLQAVDVPAYEHMDSKFWSHLDPSRIAVPGYVVHSFEVERSFTSIFCHRYHNILRVVVWLFFLVVYSQAGTPPPHSRELPDLFIFTVREPLERLDPLRRHFDFWEVVLYVMGLAFLLEGVSILAFTELSTKS